MEVASGGGARREDAGLSVSAGPDGALIAIGTSAQSTGRDHAGLVADRLGLPPDRLDADAQAIRDADGGILWTLAEALDRAAAVGPFGVTGTAQVVATLPSGCHVTEGNVGPETGALRLMHHLAVHDCGRVLSPHGVEGRIQGGAVLEGHAFDPTGQLLAASLMDHALPWAFDLPGLAVIAQDVPSATSPLGAKGAGEAGTTGALAAVVDAAALCSAGARLSLTPLALWQAIHHR